MINMRLAVGQCDIVLITLDTLRFDVAQAAMASGETPAIAKRIGNQWDCRHSPATFTFAAHQAFFGGFFPSPNSPGPHERLFACRFAGSESVGSNTWVCDSANIVKGLELHGYHTVCIGGTGFFNMKNELGSVLPNMFLERHWSPSLGVTDKNSTRNQIDIANRVLSETPKDRRLFLFINISAIHKPNFYHLPKATIDSVDSMRAALRYVDKELHRLFTNLDSRSPWCGIICSDHGEAYGEDGWYGHRIAHPKVWEVPYGEIPMREL